MSSLQTAPPSSALIATGQRLLLRNYSPAPVVMSRGEGCLLWDSDGKRYLDMTAGIAVCALGHGHVGLARAIAEQALQLIHTSNLYYVQTQIAFAEALAQRAFQGRAFFCNSGAEANEAALKLARRYQAVVRQQPERTEILAFEGSFHGRTAFSLSVTGQEKYRAGFGPLVPGVRFVPFGDGDAARAAITERTGALIIEPVQAEGGILVPPPGYLRDLRALCSERGVVLIFDEVQTGVGRTGTFYAFEQEGVVPDIITLAKGIAGGVPMGVMLANEEVARGFEPGTHASTFGGNPLACAAALYIQKAIDELGLLERARTLGVYLAEQLAGLAARFPALASGTRGRGLLQGLVLTDAAAPRAAEIISRARDNRLLLSLAGGRVVRFVPALVVEKAHLDEAVLILEGVLAGL